MTGRIVWFTGLPASGKSTLAERLRARLVQRGTCAVILDSDAIRGALGASIYTPAARDAFYLALGELALVIARQGVIVLVAATAPRRTHRDHVRDRGFPILEVWVTADAATCASRDVKGLYAAAGRGELATLPGAGATFEPPVHADLTATGGMDDAALAELEQLLA
ncbi:MAG: adenylyl-sulfate kinase [Kofleriaceae bacterium]